ncbi:4Fe-4S binding protein [bacterium]|nr:4Fe-4S binding protein [bacterium]
MSIDLSKLKAGGFIAQCQRDYFCLRVRIPCGNVTKEQMIKLAEISEKFGKGYLHITSRQGFEIPFVHIDNFDSVVNEFKSVDLVMGACGPRVRVVTACQGSNICPQGIGESDELARRLDETYYGKEERELPHKFKMGVTGCPSDCLKAQENDLGFLGVAEPVLCEKEGEECSSCGLCVEVCPGKAITLVDGKPVIDKSKCYKDAKCVLSCPTSALKIKRQGWDVYIGGRFGKEPELGKFFTGPVSTDEAVKVAGQVLEAYIELANRGERLGVFINRIGLDKFKERAGV